MNVLAVTVSRKNADRHIVVVGAGPGGLTAAMILAHRGFRVTVVGDHPYPGVAPDIVLRQSPQAGFQIAQGEAISLEVSQ